MPLAVDMASSEDEVRSLDDHHTEDDEDELGSGMPIDYFDVIKGYEYASFDAVSVPPPGPSLAHMLAAVRGEKPKPASDEEQDGTDGVVLEDASAPALPPPLPVKRSRPVIALDSDFALSEDAARSALLDYLGGHCCYGKAAAKNMVIKQMDRMPAFHYEVQTYCERRETSWTYTPIRMGVDVLGDDGLGHGHGHGLPPMPWEIEEAPTQVFKDEVRLVGVPNTARIKSCHRCKGTGGIQCRECNGRGWSRCLHCHGDGWMHDSHGFRERCFYCHHSSSHGGRGGEIDCKKCNKKGKVNCVICQGKGQIRCYIQLTITWKVYTAEHIVDKLQLPHDLIRDVSGQVAYEEESDRVQPLDAVGSPSDSEADANHAGLNEISHKLLTNHSNSFADQKIIRQRHQVRIVPVTRVTYEWKGRQHAFCVYGYEGRVHLARYPQQCCWGCNIV